MLSILLFLGILLLISFSIAIMFGSGSISPKDILIASYNRLLGRPTGVSIEIETIIFNIRLPRALFAIISGAALSVAGTTLQALLRNPLAEPYVLGVSSGAAL